MINKWSVVDILTEGMRRRSMQESINADLRQKVLRDKMIEREEARRKYLELLYIKPMGNA